MTPEIQTLMGRYNRARYEFELFRPLLTKAYFFTKPKDSNFYKIVPGEERGWQVKDSTAQFARQGFVGGFSSAVIPRDNQFFIFSAGYGVDPADKDDINRQLEDFTDRWFNYLNNSNFYMAATEAIEDLCIGTGALYIKDTEEFARPWSFAAAPIRDIRIENGPDGDVKTVWREYDKFPIADIEVVWPNAKLTDMMRSRMGDDKNAQADLLEGFVYDAAKKTWCLLLSDLTGNDVLLYEEGLRSTPWVVFRFSKAPYETFGRGPAIEALPAIQCLNQMMWDEQVQMELAINPPWIASSNSVVNVNNLRIQPGAVVTAMPTLDGKPGLQQLVTQSNFPATQAKGDQLRQQILNLFLTEPLGPIDSPQKTATETIQRMTLAQQRFGPAFSRFDAEFYRPLVTRTLFILQEQSMAPTFIVGKVTGKRYNLSVDGLNVTLSIKTPIMQAEGLARLQRLLQHHAVLLQIFGPEVAMLAYKENELPYLTAEWGGVDLSIVRNKDEMEEARKMLLESSQAKQPTTLGGPSSVKLPNVAVTA